MYKRIMLTLDRSGLAEQALPHAVAMAKAFKAELALVTVVPVATPDTALEFGAHVNWDEEVREDQEYLRGIIARVQEEGLRVASDLLRGDIAEEILRYAQDEDVDLIIMSTHGRSGMGRWVYGSIADRVLRHATVPVLLVRSTEA